MYALKLYDHHEEITQTLLREQDELPTVAQVMVGPTQGKLSLVLSAYGKPSTMIAEHPPINERRLLRVYYEGPHLFEVEWVDSVAESSRDQQAHSTMYTHTLTSTTSPDSGWRLK